MGITLILNTPDFTIEGNIVTQTIELEKNEYKNKSIKQVVSNHLFAHLLEGQDETIINQTLDLVFSFIQPVNLKKTVDWWDQPFETLIAKNTNEIQLDLEFSQEGLSFIKQMQ
ncbi:MAG: hypothetical protein FK731_04785 [Asgard group archaeon]|nr:hypothetical protein [Asgard group archaeon]